MAITTHWIAETKGSSVLQLKLALIAFHHLCQNHTGASMARAVMYLLDRAGVTRKVRLYSSVLDACSLLKAGHFTLDNALNNATMMESLEVRF